MAISKHFSLAELLRTSHGDNIPNEHAVSNLRRLARHVLDPLREAMGWPIRVNSGYRSPSVNAAVGGSKRSQHLQGQAADLTIPGEFSVWTWSKRDSSSDWHDSARSIVSQRLHSNLPITANGVLFTLASAAAKGGRLPIHQAISERGGELYTPDWVHVGMARKAGDSIRITRYDGSGYQDVFRMLSRAESNGPA